VKVVEMFRAYSMGEKWNAYRVFLGEPERKRTLRRPRCRWEDNIKIHVKEIG
jgi:hypothetical protein